MQPTSELMRLTGDRISQVSAGTKIKNGNTANYFNVKRKLFDERATVIREMHLYIYGLITQIWGVLL